MKFLSFRVFVYQLLILLSIAFGAIAHAQDVEVNSADPDTAVQGTVDLDVIISGSGFDNSADVDFFVTGTSDPGGVNVKKVKVRGSKKIVATIDIDPEAIVDLFDIEVSLSSGRKGRGTTKFSVQAKPKPHEEPPEPPPGDGAACASSDDFPAMAYSITRVVNEHKKFEKTRTDFYVSNADGSCSIVVFSTTAEPKRLRYSQGATQGRLVWHQNGPENAGRKDCHGCPIIMSVTFDLVNKEIVTPLPLTATTVYAHPAGGNVGIIGLDLTVDSSRLYYMFTESDPVVNWLYNLNVIDLTTCSENCSPTSIHTFHDDGSSHISLNPSGNRIYFNRHVRNIDLYAVVFTEEQSGIWSPVRNVVTDQDSGYASFEPVGTSAALWDHDGDGIRTEVLAFDRGDGTFDIFDVENCSANGSSQSCLATGEATILRTSIPGWLLTFTEHPSNSSDPAPNILVFVDGNIAEVDPDSGNNLGVLVPNSTEADSTN